MALIKTKLGKLLQFEDERNSDNKYSLTDVKGISIQKVFIETKADMEGVSLSPYILVKPDFFAYVTVTSRNGEKITIAHNTTKETYIVSSSYVVFSVKNPELLDPDYLFMYFNRPEFDRYSRFNSWGSARETFSWEDMCDIDFELPSIDTQRRYVSVYRAMIANQQSYERGLGDLKLACDGILDSLKKKDELVRIGNYITQIDNRNNENLPLVFSGLSMDNYFISSIADANELDFTNYKIVRPGELAAVLMKVGRDGRLTIARNDLNDSIMISPAYYTFSLSGIDSSYFMANVNRPEFERRAWFSCDTSARGSLAWDEFLNLKIPKASVQEQKTVAGLYTALIERQEINEKLKKTIRDICPILIKGSLGAY